MTEEKQYLVAYLKGKAGNRELMTPAQLAEEIGISPKQQSELRKTDKFPIPHENFGRRVYYSIHAIADFLLRGKTEQKTAPKKQEKVETKPLARQKAAQQIRKGPIDLSQMILLGFMIDRLKAQREQMDMMIGSFEQLMKAKSLRDELEQTLATKGMDTNKVVKPAKV